MKKKLIGGLLCCFISVNANALSAVEALKITKNSEKKLESQVQNNKKLKKIFDAFIKEVYEDIKNVAKSGYLYSIWLSNSEQVVENINKLKKSGKISKEEFRIIKKSIERKLTKDGYKVQFGKYDGEYNFHLRIDW